MKINYKNTGQILSVYVFLFKYHFKVLNEITDIYVLWTQSIKHLSYTFRPIII
jgi:hypothetical protein